MYKQTAFLGYPLSVFNQNSSLEGLAHTVHQRTYQKKLLMVLAHQDLI